MILVIEQRIYVFICSLDIFVGKAIILSTILRTSAIANGAQAGEVTSKCMSATIALIGGKKL